MNNVQNFKGAQRQTMVVTSLPGLSEWAQTLEDKDNCLKHLHTQPNTSKRLNQHTKLKRTYEETEEDAEAMDVVENEVGSKEQKTDENVNSAINAVSREHLLNFPLPDVPSKSCIAKVTLNVIFFIFIFFIYISNNKY